jgi:hypothetical protein
LSWLQKRNRVGILATQIIQQIVVFCQTPSAVGFPDFINVKSVELSRRTVKNLVALIGDDKSTNQNQKQSEHLHQRTLVQFFVDQLTNCATNLPNQRENNNG